MDLVKRNVSVKKFECSETVSCEVKQEKREVPGRWKAELYDVDISFERN